MSTKKKAPKKKAPKSRARKTDARPEEVIDAALAAGVIGDLVLAMELFGADRDALRDGVLVTRFVRNTLFDARVGKASSEDLARLATMAEVAMGLLPADATMKLKLARARDACELLLEIPKDADEAIVASVARNVLGLLIATDRRFRAIDVETLITARAAELKKKRTGAAPLTAALVNAAGIKGRNGKPYTPAMINSEAHRAAGEVPPLR